MALNNQHLPRSGFFYKSSCSGNITFKQTMQVHKPGTSFKSAATSLSNIILKASLGDIVTSTKIKFNEEMSLGLDPGYDAGILRSGNGFDIYSRLVNDNGVDFAIQTLPGKSTDNYIIPIGVDTKNGGDITFSAQALSLPSTYEITLEDKLTKTQTNLTNSTDQYVASLDAGSKGIGRFYLHVGSSVQTGIDREIAEDITIYQANQNLYIKGTVDKDAQFTVYNIDGRLIHRFNAASQNLNKINISGYSSGVYVLSIHSQNQHRSLKFVIGE